MAIDTSLSSSHENQRGLDLHGPSNELVENNTGGTVTALKVVTFDRIGTLYPEIEVITSTAQIARGVVSADFLDATTGYITAFGVVVDVDTSSFVLGAILYSDASGNLTTTETAIRVGVVLKVGVSDGILWISIAGQKGEPGPPLTSVSVASITDPSPELASLSAASPGDGLIVFQEIANAANPSTLYTWDVSPGLKPNPPHCVPGTGGAWVSTSSIFFGRFVDMDLVSASNFHGSIFHVHGAETGGSPNLDPNEGRWYGKHKGSSYEFLTRLRSTRSAITGTDIDFYQGDQVRTDTLSGGSDKTYTLSNAETDHKILLEINSTATEDSIFPATVKEIGDYVPGTAKNYGILRCFDGGTKSQAVVTINSNTFTAGDGIVLAGVSFIFGVDWSAGANITSTAVNIARAITDSPAAAINHLFEPTVSGSAITIKVRNSGTAGDATTLTEIDLGTDDITITSGFGGGAEPQYVLQWEKLTDADVTMQSLGASSYKTLRDLHNTTNSAGWVSGGAISNAVAGTFDVAAGTGYIRDANTDLDDIFSFDWPSSLSIAIADEQILGVYVDYNAGTPIVSTADITTPAPFVNGRTTFLLGLIMREGTTYTFKNFQTRAVDFPFVVNQFASSAFDKPRVSNKGIILSETGTRNLAVTQGSVWVGLNIIPTVSFDSSATDDFDTYYTTDSGTTWVRTTAQTQWDNTQYNNIASGLATLSNNRYGVQWVYRLLDGSLSVLFGQAEYLTEAQAEASGVPVLLPSKLKSQLAWLIGRVIFQESDATAIEVESVYGTQFTGAAASSHANLSNITPDDHHSESHTVASHSDTTATGAELETLTNASNADALHSHAHSATTGQTADDHHSEAHTIASHSDTTATGAELETLTNGSNADALHVHAGGGGETNTASNVGTAGVGVFKQKTVADLEFKKINAGSSKVTIIDDVANSEVDIDVVEANIDHDALSNFVAAEHVDWAGAGAGTIHASNYVDNDTVYTHPNHTGEITSTGDGAQAVDKTAISNKTLVTAAVGDHVLVGDASDTDNLKKVTVQTIVDLASGSSPDASETVKGIVELATQAETDTGTDDVRAITPLKLKTSPVKLHATTHKSGGTDAIKLDELAAPTDITTLNVSITAHGLAPKAPNDATKFLNGVGAYAVPPDNDTVYTHPNHTGEITSTGDGAQAVDKTAISNKTLVTAAVGDHVLVGDASDTDNLKKVTVQTIVDLAAAGSSFPVSEFFADDFLSPVNADWVVNALAPVAVDSNNARHHVRLFDDTTEEGVGFDIYIPSTATNIKFSFVSRAETAPAGVRTVGLKLYECGSIAGAPDAWSAGTVLTDIDIPATESFVLDTQTISLATLGLTAGNWHKFELTRINPTGGTELVGDFALFFTRVEFT